jgi:hypothetical protein
MWTAEKHPQTPGNARNASLGTVRRDETLISFEGPNHFDPSTDLGFGLDCSVPLIHNAVDGKTPACNLKYSAVAYIAHLIASRKAFLGCITVRTDRSHVSGRSRSFSRSSSMNERDPAATATELNGLKSFYQFSAVLRVPNAAAARVYCNSGRLPRSRLSKLNCASETAR